MDGGTFPRRRAKNSQCFGGRSATSLPTNCFASPRPDWSWFAAGWGARASRSIPVKATVTRCCVRSDSGKTGHAYILGRDHKHARLAAEVDAALQQDENREGLMNSIIMPLAERHEAKLDLHRKKVAATKVDFFTLVRGEDE